MSLSIAREAGQATGLQKRMPISILGSLTTPITILQTLSSVTERV